MCVAATARRRRKQLRRDPRYRIRSKGALGVSPKGTKLPVNRKLK